MKRFLSAILSALAVVTLLSSCSAEKNYDKNLKIEENSQIITETPDKEIPVSETEEKNETIHTVYFKDSAKSSSATATFFNSANGSSENVEMEKIGEDSDAMTFSCEGDTSKYNMVYVTSGGKQSMEFAFNKCVSGWCRTDDDFFPYTQGDDIDFTPTFDNVTLSGYGYDKNIHIWKPDDYDASSEEKYSTIYILDGQNIADFGINGIEFKTRPGFIEQVRSMSMETGSKAIIVAVENLDMREYELIPDMEVSKQERKEIAENGLDAGEPVDVHADYDAMNGIQFAHFIAKKVVPYVQQNYNVYKDALHTSVQGASLGGMESFYIACEYPDTFGSVGAMSPSFYEFDGETWKEYLSEKSFTDSSPFIYLYTGPAGADTDPHVTDMYERLRDLGYPKEKLALHFNEEGTHSGIFWRSVFSEYLTAMVFQNIEPLQKDQT